jgi:hypothetical protein
MSRIFKQRADVKRDFSDFGENLSSPVKYRIWIPAFAGMTIGGANRRSRGNKWKYFLCSCRSFCTDVLDQLDDLTDC